MDLLTIRFLKQLTQIELQVKSGVLQSRISMAENWYITLRQKRVFRRFMNWDDVKMIKTTLLGFVKAECADYVNSECLGIDVFGKRFIEQGSCFILENKPCMYFVRCVLPIAKERGYGNVISSYQKIDIDSKLMKFKTRKCECGIDIPKGKQICEICRKKRRQITKRMYQQKYRGSWSTEVAFLPVLSLFISMSQKIIKTSTSQYTLPPIFK